MRAKLFLKQLEATAFEQDVKVTVTDERDVHLEPGDEVDLLVRARVGTVSVQPGAPPEVSIEGAVPVKVLAVRRPK